MELQELGAGDADEEQRRFLRTFRETFDDVEDRRLGPLEIVHDDDCRSAGDSGEVLPGAPSDLPSELRRDHLGQCLLRGPQAEHRRKPRADRHRAGTVRAEERAGPRLKLRDRLFPIVLAGDTRVLAHDLHERPIGDAGAIREAPATENVRAVGARDPREGLAHQTRLADPGIADDGEEVRPPLVAHPLERFEQHPELTLPADELRAHRGQTAGLLRDEAARPDRPECLDRIGLSLRGHRLAHRVLDRRSGQ